MHQRRAAESLAMQREQTQRLASNLSTEMSRISTSFSSDDVLEEGERNPVTPPLKSSQQTSVSSSRQSSSPTGEFFSDISNTLPPKQPTKTTTPSSTRSPQVYSTPNRNRSADRWTPQLGVGSSSGQQQDHQSSLFPHSASPKVVGSVRHKKKFNDEDVMPSDIVPKKSYQGSSSSTTSPLVAAVEALSLIHI